MQVTIIERDGVQYKVTNTGTSIIEEIVSTYPNGEPGGEPGPIEPTPDEIQAQILLNTEFLVIMSEISMM